MSGTIYAADAGTTLISSISTARAVKWTAVATQVGISVGASIAIVIGFSLFRPRLQKVYAPKIKYQLHAADDPDYEPPPPPLTSSFFAWLSPVVNVKERQMLDNIGMDATIFLRLIRMFVRMLGIISVYSVGLLVINVIYNIKYSSLLPPNQDPLIRATLANLTGAWIWPAVAYCYIITFTVLFFVWRNWKYVNLLRHDWFRSPQYQHKVYSRTLMITQIPKEYRSDEGLVHLMSQLKLDGIKIAQEISCTAIGRILGDFPELIDQHNEAIKDLEKILVKYLRHGKMAHKRPTIRKGGFMCCGGRKLDAIEYYAKQIKYLRDQVDARRADIHNHIRQERKQRKERRGGPAGRTMGENYGFVTLKTVAEAHRIAREHSGNQKELGGAHIQLAPSPNDILWQNIKQDSVELASKRMFGFFLIGCLFIAYAAPTFLVSVFANLETIGAGVPAFHFIIDWKNSSSWTFSVVTGTIGPVLQSLFLLILPILIRRICKRQGVPTRSRLDRATTARYYFITTVWMLFFLSIFGVIYSTVNGLIHKVGHESAQQIYDELKESLPRDIFNAYTSQTTYWLTWLPLRGMLVIFDLIQILKLALVSWRRLLFHYTPRDIRELTAPYKFEYHVVSVNLIFVVTIALVYSPIAPLVVFVSFIAMFLSYIVYKYQLLYVYISRSESGGRMWNVYINRVLFSVLAMQLLMIFTTALIRLRWFDTLAVIPPVLILIGFKIWMAYTEEANFTYYRPTADEAEEQRRLAMNEKPIDHSDMERKFLHPALRKNKVMKIMVHKSQESLARQVLSAYPWFAEKHDTDGTQIQAVREENLEYDPKRDGLGEGSDWDARSVSSANMLNDFDDASSVYSASPYISHATLPKPPLSRMASDNKSTDELLAYPAPQGYANPPAIVTNLTDPWDRGPSPNYPPTSFSQAELYRAASGASSGEDQAPLNPGGYGYYQPSPQTQTPSYPPFMGARRPSNDMSGRGSPLVQTTSPPQPYSSPRAFSPPQQHSSPRAFSPSQSPYTTPYAQSPPAQSRSPPRWPQP